MNIDMDGALLDEARRAAGLRTEQETPEEGLRSRCASGS
jgi:hypothetical protein